MHHKKQAGNQRPKGENMRFNRLIAHPIEVAKVKCISAGRSIYFLPGDRTVFSQSTQSKELAAQAIR
jgi:hypothetical protein